MSQTKTLTTISILAQLKWETITFIILLKYFIIASSFAEYFYLKLKNKIKISFNFDIIINIIDVHIYSSHIT